VTSQTDTDDDAILQFALRHARDTRRLKIAPGGRWDVDAMLGELFGNAPCIIVADDNTFAAAGKEVYDALRRAGRDLIEPLIFNPVGLYAEYSFVTQIQNSLATNRAIPIAVGAGAIIDLTKLAAHVCGRRYMSVATAASMDGYTAFGASITREGAKQTLDCPAPLGVIADLDVIAAAPEGLNASGYADLIAKCPAGADWILADALGIDPIDDANWQMVQAKLRDWLADPLGVRRRDYEATRRLTMALMITGFAMQAACSSRPVSGAEHQFSHLWDMENHTHHGTIPSHGFKVGIGTLASIALYEVLLSTDVANLDVDSAVDAWPDVAANEREIAELFPSPDVERKALLESGAKHVDRETLRAQLQLLKREWPRIHDRLARQIMSRSEVHDMLRAAGCPVAPEQIGIPPERLRASFRKAYHIRRRFTILDVVRRANLWEPALDTVFATWKTVA
jgi:glycerol-1-phosphate dehydrogenase [NAD(P)+]